MDISHSAMVDADAPDTEELRTVPKVTLDRFTAGHGLSGPFLLKVDIDGHEMQVLRGAERTLQACSIVIVECAGSSLPERIGFMQDRGFRLFDLCEPCYYDDCFWQADAVFLSRQAFADHFKNLYDTFDERLYARFA
jgi:hypothetical protein